MELICDSGPFLTESSCSVSLEREKALLLAYFGGVWALDVFDLWLGSLLAAVLLWW